jgi:hypothetical protein
MFNGSMVQSSKALAFKVQMPSAFKVQMPMMIKVQFSLALKVSHSFEKNIIEFI